MTTSEAGLDEATRPAVTLHSVVSTGLVDFTEDLMLGNDPNVGRTREELEQLGAAARLLSLAVEATISLRDAVESAQEEFNERITTHAVEAGAAALLGIGAEVDSESETDDSEDSVQYDSAYQMGGDLRKPEATNDDGDGADKSQPAIQTKEGTGEVSDNTVERELQLTELQTRVLQNFAENEGYVQEALVFVEALKARGEGKHTRSDIMNEFMRARVRSTRAAYENAFGIVRNILVESGIVECPTPRTLTLSKKYLEETVSAESLSD